MRKSVDILAELAAQDADCRTDLRVATGAMVAAFDGPAGLASIIRKEFDSANPGSTVRTKIVTTILDLMGKAGEQEELFEDEDYAAMERHLQGGNGSAV